MDLHQSINYLGKWSVREHQHSIFIFKLSWTFTFYNNVALTATIYLVYYILYVCQRFKTSDTTFETHMRMGHTNQCLTSGHACCLKVSTEGKRLCCLLGGASKMTRRQKLVVASTPKNCAKNKEDEHITRETEAI